MNKNLLIGLGVFLAVILAGFFLVRKPKVTTTGMPVPPGNNGGVQAKEIAVSASEYSFSPSAITVAKGERVRIVFTNNGSFSHDFTVGDLGLKTAAVAPGESTTLEFTAGETGGFIFYCSIDGHKGLGMEGKLEIK